MKYAAVAFVVALALVAPGSAQQAAVPVDFTGTYSVTGTAPDGAYTATAELIAHGPVYEIRWTFPQGDGMAGVGFVEGDALIVGFATATQFGATAGTGLYRVTVKQPLTLEGRWTGWGHTEISTERLVKGPPAIRAQR